MDKPYSDESVPISGDALTRALELAAKEHWRLRLTGGPDEIPYYTNVRALTETQMLLDALEPLVSEEALMVGADVAFAFPLSSRGYFTGRTVFQGQQSRRGAEMRFLVARPTALRYYRQRRHTRFLPAEDAPATCLTFDGQPAKGKIAVKDIGLEGVCLVFAEPLDIGANQRIAEIRLKLWPGEHLVLAAKVRHVRDEKGGFSVGLMWDPMDKKQFLTLRDYVLHIQKLLKGRGASLGRRR